MRQIPTPLNNEERFYAAIVERLDAILEHVKPQVKADTPEPVKAHVAPVKAPKKARKKQEG